MKFKKFMNTKSLLPVWLFCIVLISACTSFEEELKQERLDYQTLNPENIVTDLKLVNLKVAQNEFDDLSQNYFEAIEVEGKMDIYQNNMTLISDEEVELEIKGTSSAHFSLKSLGVKFEDTFDNSQESLISINALPAHSLQKIKAFRLRNSGNDFKESMIKDMSLTQLAIQAKLDIDLTYSEQVVVFVNDKFHGLMNLRTEANANGIAKKYEVDKDRITLAKIIAGGEVVYKNGDENRMEQFFEAIAERNFEYLRDEIDLDNFIDYMIFESYVGNEDWPKNNVRLFSIDETPFRFILYDLDFVHSIGLKAPWKDFIDANFFPSDANPIGDLFNILYENESFKIKFDNRYKALLDSELLSSTRFDEIVNAYSRNIEALMPIQIDKHQSPNTFFEWNIFVERLKENFRIREAYLKGK